MKAAKFKGFLIIYSSDEDLQSKIDRVNNHDIRQFTYLSEDPMRQEEILKSYELKLEDLKNLDNDDV